MKIAFRTFSQWWEEKQIRLQYIPFLPRTFENFVVLMTTQSDLPGCMWLAICLCAASKIEGDIHHLPVFGCDPPNRALTFLRFYFSMSSFFFWQAWFNRFLICYMLQPLPGLCYNLSRCDAKPSSWFRIPTELHQLDSGTLRELKSAFQALLWNSCSFSWPSPAVLHAPPSSIWVFANLNKHFSNYLHQAFYVD